MATFFWFVLLQVGKVTMATVTGWQGLLIAFGYLMAVVWDCLAIARIVN